MLDDDVRCSMMLRGDTDGRRNDAFETTSSFRYTKECTRGSAKRFLSPISTRLRAEKKSYSLILRSSSKSILSLARGEDFSGVRFADANKYIHIPSIPGESMEPDCVPADDQILNAVLFE